MRGFGLSLTNSGERIKSMPSRNSYCLMRAVLQLLKSAYFLHASESGWFRQFGRIIRSEHPLREFDGLGRQRKIISARAIRGATIKCLHVHRDIRDLKDSRELAQQIFGVAVRDIALAFCIDDLIPSHDLSSDSRAGLGSTGVYRASFVVQCLCVSQHSHRANSVDIATQTPYIILSAWRELASLLVAPATIAVAARRCRWWQASLRHCYDCHKCIL